MYDNVLFLDVDGVLNSGPWLMLETQKSKDFHRRTDMDIDAMSLDPEAVARLQRIVDATGSSLTWEQVADILEKKFDDTL